MNTIFKNISTFVMVGFMVLAPYATPLTYQSSEVDNIPYEAGNSQSILDLVEAEAAGCDPSVGISVSNFTVSGSTAQATLTNNSQNCNFNVAIASYKVYRDHGASDFVESQTLHDSRMSTIGPGDSRTLLVNVPSCRHQVDVFEGSNIPEPPTFRKLMDNGTHWLFDWDIDHSKAKCSAGPVAEKPAAQTTSATNIGQTSATLNGRVDPNGASADYWFEYGRTTSLGSRTSTGNAGAGDSFTSVARGISGLSAGTTYFYRIVAENSQGRATGSILSFTTKNAPAPPTPPPSPTVSKPTAQTQSAANVSTSSATLRGRVNPNNASTDYRFEYGTSVSLGNSTSQQFVGSGSIFSSASKTISGLQQNTTYFYRIVAENSQGTSRGSILSFTTNQSSVPEPENPPTVSTDFATQTGQTFATLNGQVDPNGSDTTFWFKYGTDQNTNQSTSQFSVGSGDSPINRSRFIANLQPNTTYFFRAVAQNQHGITEGSIKSFTTDGSDVGGGDVPTAQTQSANNVSQASADVEGRVDPNGLSTQFWFEYGTTQSLGQSTPQTSAGSGDTEVTVTRHLIGLSENTTYFYRVAAQNTNGTTRGSILSFTTNTDNNNQPSQEPDATTRSATNIDEDSARLRGEVDPNGAFTDYWFEYGRSSSLGNRTSFRSAGSGNGEIDVDETIFGLEEDERYFYRIVARNAHGTDRGSIRDFRTDDDNGGGFFDDEPEVNTRSATNVDEDSARLRGEVDPNGDDTIAWFEYGTNRNALVFTTNTEDMGDGTSDRDFSERVGNLSSNTTYFFRAVARNSEGTERGNTLSFTTDSNGGGPTQGAPGVLTDSTSFVARNSAIINGRVNPRGTAATAWFEYGTTASLGQQTAPQSVGSGNSLRNYSSALSGLLPNTTYFYRAVAQNAAGQVQGSLRSFNTSPVPTGPPTPPPTPQPPVVVPSGPGAACLTLEPGIDEPQLEADNDYLYSLIYRNDCNFALQDTRLQITLPFEVTFADTNHPILTRDANVITYDLGVVARNFQSIVIVEGNVREDVEDGDSVIFKADVTFTDPDNDLQSVSAFLTAFVEDGGLNAFTANLLNALGDLFGNGWFWLLLLLILLAILGYWYWRKRRLDKVEAAIDEPIT